MKSESKFEEWALLHDVWYERNLAELCCGLIPDGARPNTEELNKASEAIRLAVIAGTLEAIPTPNASAGDSVFGSARAFLPTEAIAWAARKFPKFPFKASPAPSPMSAARKEPTAACDPQGVTVHLPHTNKTLDAVFKIMRENWTDPDARRMPKQVNIAHEIDDAMGWKSQGDGSPSRNAKALAAAIKPDGDTE